jgi:hypothetical protein
VSEALAILALWREARHLCRGSLCQRLLPPPSRIDDSLFSKQKRRVDFVLGGTKVVPGDPKECRQHALHCVLLAKEASSEESKKTFLNLAQHWNKLAVELEHAEVLIKALKVEREPDT